MKPSKIIKVWIGLFTVWLVLTPLIFFASLSYLGAIEQDCVANDCTWVGTPGFPRLILFVLIAFVTVIVYLNLIGYYWMHIVKNSSLSKVAKIMLAIGVLILPYVVMPFYYYLYIWRN